MILNELTIKEARAKLDAGEITSLELTDACLAVINKLNPELNAVLTICESEARSEARAADKRIKDGEDGDLLGIPYLCKDIIMTKGIRTTAASKILENYIAPYDATVIKKLKEAGAVLLGKTNLDEFAHGASTENSAYGVTKNPLDLTRVPGGSSGGSAAAVAANMCIFALGTDTGGSIRQPASFCGLYGLKPSYGRVSRFGLLSMTSSTDVIGPLAKSAYDAALILKTIAGRDDRDATSAPEAIMAYEKEITDAKSGKEGQALKGIKIGLPKEYYLSELNPGIALRLEEMSAKLKAAGAELKIVSLPYTEYGIPVYYLITPSEISSNLARFDGIGWGLAKNETANLQEFYKTNRGFGFGPEVKRRILLGTYALSAGYYDAYYKKAQAVRTLIINDFTKVFSEVDILLTPTSPHPAFKIGEQVNDPLAMYMEDIFVTGASLAGLPAMSIPAGLVKTEEGNLMPVGAQFIAPRLEEGKLFKVIGVLEK
ncbi:MAG: Asp-tRNA(Asn)/Glu-tRNA(Gln) amidotransferase subunit GatA [Patescibacteria group bacterium]